MGARIKCHQGDRWWGHARRRKQRNSLSTAAYNRSSRCMNRPSSVEVDLWYHLHFWQDLLRTSMHLIAPSARDSAERWPRRYMRSQRRKRTCPPSCCMLLSGRRRTSAFSPFVKGNCPTCCDWSFLERPQKSSISSSPCTGKRKSSPCESKRLLTYASSRTECHPR